MVLTTLSVDVMKGIVERYGQIRKLNLSSNGIEFLEDMTGMHFLRSLNLACNHLRNIASLSALSNLNELDLRENDISDITPLLKLKKLQKLDLSFNQLSSIDVLRDLGDLQGLVALDLLGNPICSLTERYPEILFNMIPSLESIDGRSRAEYQGSATMAHPISANKTHDTTQTSPKLNGTIDQLMAENEDLKSKIEHLEQLLVMMERSFNEQERELSASVLATTKRAKDGEMTSKDADSQNDVALGKEGFSRLLKLWRRKLMQTLMDKSLLEQKLNFLQKEIERVKGDTSDVILNQRSQLESSTRAVSQTQADNAFLRRNLSELEVKVEEYSRKIHNLQEKLSTRDKDIHVMRLFFEEFKKQLDSSMVNLSQRMMEASGQLQLMDARLLSASQRVCFAASMVTERKVHDRNSMASAIAMALKNRSLYKQDGISTREELQSYHDPEKSNNVDSKKPNLIDLAPEAESLLSSVFRQMDTHDAGYVNVKLLIECLLHGNGALLQLLNSALGGGNIPHILNDDADQGFELHWESCSSWAARFLYVLLKIVYLSGANSENDFGALKDVSIDVTWGEFLLILAVSRDDFQPKHSIDAFISSLVQPGEGLDCFLTLSRAESLALRKKCLLGDHQWAMLPLSIPSMADISQHHGRDNKNCLLPTAWLLNTGTSIESVQRLRNEALRLSKERSFLLSRLQEMNRTLERRVEAAKDHFRSEIKEAVLKEEKARSELRQAQHAEREIKAIHGDLINSSNEQIHRLTERMSQLQEENMSLKREQERERGEMEQLLHDQLEEQRTKHSKLETEYRLLKKESCKMEVLTKTLQRDIQRLQSLYSAEANSRQALEERNEKRDEKLDALEAQNELLKEHVKLLQLENADLKEQCHSKQSGAAPIDVPRPAPNEPNPSVPSIESADSSQAHDKQQRQKELPAEVRISSSVAIDSVMEKLKMWTQKLNDIERGNNV